MQAAFPLTSTEAVSLHYCAGDVKLFEGCHTQRAPQVIGRPDESIRSCNGDSRFTGRQDHHYSFDVWDGETRVLSETPDTHTHRRREEGDVTGRDNTSVTDLLRIRLM